MQRILELYVLLVFALIQSCASKVNLEISRVEPFIKAKNEGLVAGVAKIDITPQAGMPMGGYSLFASTAEGYRTKLYAKAFYIKSGDNKPIVLVQADLQSGSRILQAKVAELVAKKTDVAVGSLNISGTHTHSAPANFFGSEMYNQHSSNKVGFDKEFFDFLANKIAKVVIEAYENRRKAKIATGSVEIFGVTRNRSIDAFAENFDREYKKDEYKAVNPTYRMIRIDTLRKDGTYKPAGAYSSFSIHGTAISSANNLYNGDVFSYIENELEWDVKRKGLEDNFVHGVVNGTHGDNSPDFGEKQGFDPAKRLGLAISKKANKLFHSLKAK